MGVYPTRYGNLSNDQLYAMFRESIYSKLAESEKLAFLQETVNHDALEKGGVVRRKCVLQICRQMRVALRPME